MLLPFVLASAVAAAAGSPALSAGTYRYSATYGGTPVGTSSITVAPDGSATKLDETASGQMSGLQFSGTATLTLGQDLAPVRYDGNYEISGQKATATASVNGSSATTAATMTGGAPQSFALGSAAHFVVIEPGLMVGLFALPAQMQAWNDAPALAVAPSYGRSEPIAPAAPATPPARPANVPAADAVLSLGGHVPVTIWYDPATLVPDEVIVPSQDVTIDRMR